MRMPDSFWTALDALVAASHIIIDRPKGSTHPRVPDIVYVVDYGYLTETTAMDGQGIDIWRGTDPAQRIDAVMCTVDLWKKDAELKILIGCTEEEKALINDFINNAPSMKGIMVRRND